ncbi:hypothetical protein [Lusitaniella coriacea]|uniref:hypothetical protein n=1 Tax=Lusitaniella coriacea TaxID=1983105 RepID=UPI003CEC9E5D
MLQSQQTLQNRYRLQTQLGNNPTRQTWIAEEKDRVNFLSASAKHLNTEQQIETALQIAQSFQDKDNKNLTLSAIAQNIKTVQKFDMALEASSSLPESKEKQVFLHAIKQNLETLKKEEEARKKIWITL